MKNNNIIKMSYTSHIKKKKKKKKKKGGQKNIIWVFTFKYGPKSS